MLTHCTTADSHTRTRVHTHTYTHVHRHSCKHIQIIFVCLLLYASCSMELIQRRVQGLDLISTPQCHTRVFLTCRDGSVHTMVKLPAGITPHNGYITCREHSPQWLYYSELLHFFASCTYCTFWKLQMNYVSLARTPLSGRGTTVCRLIATCELLAI